ncbi:Tat pathway signal sequence domain-containing protein [Candidatus Desulfarcum epimagneticum]|uniref:Tat pathway signal sequence domain-containing protein n=1 Tax=uncultured Desulfobacteraceae bacterium TaxID=218296 RepID=A0A484HJ05_9BACT|nr:Tat pathway signal sequence domain-containing protein [uncultured Desulfobacteraceae bacterium]
MTDINRREFIRRSVKAGLVSASALVAGWGLRDTNPPALEPATEALGGIPDFSKAPGAGPAMAIGKGTDRGDLARRTLGAMGGMRRFVQPGDRVVIKVNAAFASPPAISATSHPDLVKEVTLACVQAGASDVVVTDNPIHDPAGCFRLTGIGAAAEEAGGRVVLPAADLFANVSLPGARLIRDWPVLVGPLAKADRLIGVAPLKDHHRSGASMTIKNWYGLLGGRRNVFHQDIHTIIAELAALARPTLVILDAVTTMRRNGPTGGSISDLDDTNTLVAGIDPVAVDAVGAWILGRELSQLPHLQQAADAGLGVLDYRTLNPVDVP